MPFDIGVHELIVGLYLAVAALCLRSGGPWPGLGAAALGACGLAKGTHAQGLVLRNLRNLAENMGWYEQRRIVQVLAIVGFLGLLALALRARRRLGVHLFTEPALALLLVFLCVRAVSLHHLDTIVDFPLLGAHVGQWTEIVLLGWIGTRRLLIVRSRAPAALAQAAA